MFEMNEVDAQSDDTESNQDIGIGGVDLSFDNDFNDIYYQCRYERYAAFNRANLLNEVLSLCANIDRLQHEKSEVEKRLRDVQQHLYDSTSTSNNNQDRSTNEETSQTNDEDSRVRTLLFDRIPKFSFFLSSRNHLYMINNKMKRLMEMMSPIM